MGNIWRSLGLVAVLGGALAAAILAAGTAGAGGSKAGAPPQGKTTICHATGSVKNPYVRITVSNSALPAHRRHQGGRDIIPAPPQGCPGPVFPPPPPAPAP